MSRSALSVVFAGSGGSGAMTAGKLFLRTAAAAGYHGLMTQLFGLHVGGWSWRKTNWLRSACRSAFEMMK